MNIFDIFCIRFQNFGSIFLLVVPNSGPRLPFASIDFGSDQKSSYFELNHDIDTQSIYGFDQIIHRHPSNNKLDQAIIARNFSKRTLNTIPQNEEMSWMNQNVEASESQMPTGKPLRWFESGSTGSIHLGSCMEMFNETNHPMGNNRRKSSILSPFRRQSQHLIHALRLKSRRFSSQCIADEEPAKEIKKDQSMPEKLNAMLEGDEFITPNEIESQPNSCCCNVFQWFVRFFDLDLLRDNIYLNIMIGMAISIFAEINFAILTPFILSDLSFNSDEISIILFVMAIADLISRFCSPFIADKLNLSIRVSYLISLVLLVLTRMCKCIFFTTIY